MYDSGVMSSCGHKEDPFINTRDHSYKVFQLPIGDVAPATDNTLLDHKVREMERIIDTVTKIIKNSLLSTGKFCDAKYVSIFDKDKVNIYGISDTLITVHKHAVLKGWRHPESGLWRILLVLKEKI